VSSTSELLKAKIFHKKGQLNQALEIYSEILNKWPNNIKAKQGILKVYEGNLPGKTYSTHSKIQIQVLSNLLKTGKLADALLYGKIVTEQSQNEPQLYNLMGMINGKLGNSEKAISYFKKLIKVQPTQHEAYNNIGIVLKNVKRFNEAIDYFNKAIKVMPTYSSPYYNLGSLYEKLNQIENLEDLTKLASSKLQKKDPIILLFQAQLESNKGNIERSLEILLDLESNKLPPQFLTDFYSLCGKTFDKLGKFSEAFKSFEKQNKLIKELNQDQLLKSENFLRETYQLKHSWQSVKNYKSNKINFIENDNLVFLLGFPRTGTTLLDTILMGHPDITVLEEAPMAEKMVENFKGLGTPEDCFNLNKADLIELRKLYKIELEEQLGQNNKGKLIIDKHPLNTRYIPLLHHTFPSAKFIVALRHPCDCVLSCFMQNFEFNTGTGNFISLEKSTELYDATMGLWVALESKLKLSVKTVRYEDLIEDVDGICRSLISFLGLDWVDGILDHTKTAKERAQISTASYNQVTQNIYKTAKGRWSNYESELSEILPKLDPYIKKFGY
jgi:tetratricopeptide (TPR) repeat protein